MYNNSSLRTSFPVLNGNKHKESNRSNNSASWSFFGWKAGKNDKEVRELNAEDGISPVEEFVFSVPRDPLLSPYLAHDSALSKFPPLKILVQLSLK